MAPPWGSPGLPGRPRKPTQGLPRSRGDAVNDAFPGGGGPLEDYRNPGRQPLAFFHAPTCQGTVADNAFAKIVPGTVPNKLFSTVDHLAANAAAKAFYEFKDVVKAAR